MFDIYADESSQNSHHYMVLSGIIGKTAELPAAIGEFKAVRAKHNLNRELKWGKVSRQKLDAYKELVDIFFALNNRNILHFHSLIIDTHKLDHNKFNAGDKEIGFSKFIYQLLIKFGRYYGEEGPLYVYLDHRNTRQSLTDLRNVLNNGIYSRWDNGNNPYRQVVFRDSKKTDLLQINDILLGAIAYHKNMRHKLPDASQAKIALCKHICSKVGRITLGGDTPRSEKRFTVWNMALRK